MQSDHELDLRVHVVGREDCKSAHSCGPSVRDCYLFHYILSGYGIYQVGGRTYRLGAGQGFLILPHTLILYEADQADPWSYTWLGASGAQVAEFYGKSGFGPDKLIWSEERDQELEDILLRLSEMEDGSMRHPKVVGNAYLFYARMMELTGANGARPRVGNPGVNYVNVALEYMEGHYHNPMTIAEVAAHVGLDRNYLGALFKKQSGRTMQQCLMDMRMNKACELLLDTDIRIADVARSVGYTDQLQFSKAFRTKLSMSPLEYRRTIKNRRRIPGGCEWL